MLLLVSMAYFCVFVVVGGGGGVLKNTRIYTHGQEKIACPMLVHDIVRRTGDIAEISLNDCSSCCGCGDVFKNHENNQHVYTKYGHTVLN